MSQAAGGSPGRALSPRQAPPAPRLCTRAVGAAQTRSWVWFWGRRRRKLVLPLLVAARRFRTVLAPLGPPLCPFLLLVPWETPAPPQRNARSHIINSVLFVFLSFFFLLFFPFFEVPYKNPYSNKYWVYISKHQQKEQRETTAGNEQLKWQVRSIYYCIYLKN